MIARLGWRRQNIVACILRSKDCTEEISEKVSETEILVRMNNGQSQRIAVKAIRELNGSFNKRKEIPVKDQNGNLRTKDSDIEIGGLNI